MATVNRRPWWPFFFNLLSLKHTTLRCDKEARAADTCLPPQLDSWRGRRGWLLLGWAWDGYDRAADKGQAACWEKHHRPTQTRLLLSTLGLSEPAAGAPAGSWEASLSVHWEKSCKKSNAASSVFAAKSWISESPSRKTLSRPLSRRAQDAQMQRRHQLDNSPCTLTAARTKMTNWPSFTFN